MHLFFYHTLRPCVIKVYGTHSLFSYHFPIQISECFRSHPYTCYLFLTLSQPLDLTSVAMATQHSYPPRMPKFQEKFDILVRHSVDLNEIHEEV